MHHWISLFVKWAPCIKIVIIIIIIIIIIIKNCHLWHHSFFSEILPSFLIRIAVTHCNTSLLFERIRSSSQTNKVWWQTNRVGRGTCVEHRDSSYSLAFGCVTLSSAEAPAGYPHQNIFSLPPFHRAPRALFFFLPSLPTTKASPQYKEASAEERGCVKVNWCTAV